MERRLAAILSADVVGYSRLMEADEEATIHALSACRQVIDKLVANGRSELTPCVQARITDEGAGMEDAT